MALLRKIYTVCCQWQGIQSFIKINLGDFVSFSIKPVTIINSLHKWKSEYKCNGKIKFDGTVKSEGFFFHNKTQIFFEN